MMRPNPLAAYRGDDITLGGEVTGVGQRPRDITGSKIVFLMTLGADYVQKTTDDASECKITSGVGGLFEIYLKPEDTEARPVGTWHYSVRLTTQEGKLHTLASDSLTMVDP
jgi:hypothetical protein